ncbi:hypothetical protein Cgig2_016070 [Carnegiea gigantea]|uniref:Uncharacterized protein n=1 Tax=Carnegiea gigantea TaxID=171969 RepID=A0A9Q1GWB1_9CARY|nr:hypothetical protein Cgig2_016070 [Carnegiea gigantea]
MDARQVVLRSSRWLVGDGSSLNVWDDRWLPRPLSFKPVTPKSIEWSNLKVSDLIDRDSASSKTELVRHIFLECDVKLILSIPLCTTIRKASSLFVPLIICWSQTPLPMPDLPRTMTIPFGEQYGDATSPPVFGCSDESCDRGSSLYRVDFQIICGHVEETDTHAVLECPLATQIWQGCALDPSLWGGRFRTLADCLNNARQSLQKAIDFVANYRCIQENESPPPMTKDPFTWHPPLAERGNRVALNLTHGQCFSLEGELWEAEVPEDIVALASGDMFTCVDNALI